MTNIGGGYKLKRFLRNLSGKMTKDRIINEDVREEVGMHSLREKVEDGRLKWLGYMRRINTNGRNLKMWETRGKNTGRPYDRLQWLDIVNSHRKKLQMEEGVL